MTRRHPTATALGAWFDGESDDDLSGHVTGCARCRHRVRELEEIRSVLRGGRLAAPGRTWRRPRRSITVPIAPLAVAAAIALVAVVTGVVSTRPTLPFSARQATARHAAAAPATARAEPTDRVAGADGGHADTAPSEAGATTADDRTPPASGAAADHAPPSTAARPAATATAVRRPIHLATIVPVSGPLAGEGAAAADAVRRAVDAANRDGGVAGVAVELRVVAVEDRQSIAALAGWADADVGGFGAPPPRGVPWIAPADPSPATRPTVAAELSPSDVGRAIAPRLVTPDGHATKVGIIVGTGDDASLADAFRSDPSSTSVTLAAGSSCDSAVFELLRSRPAAVVLAASATDAWRCADAAARIGWDPPAGFVVAPSLVYATGPSVPFSLRHALTVLGLPWPSSSSSAGAARFRAAVPNSASYRALVSFAAAELAVDVARIAHALTNDTLLGGSFATDLLVVDHGRNTGAAIVAATDGRWEPA